MTSEPTRIIFLHGASSAGKSTLARALQDALAMPFWHISIDHLRDSGVLPTRRFEAGDFSWKAERARFFDGYHRSLAAYASAGNHLIVEHILDTPEWFKQLVTLFAPYDVFFVALHCPPAVLQEREVARGDRPRGSALKDYQTIHQGLRYDLELNALDPLKDNVARLITQWQCRQGPTIFAQQALASEDHP